MPTAAVNVDQRFPDATFNLLKCALEKASAVSLSNLVHNNATKLPTYQLLSGPR